MGKRAVNILFGLPKDRKDDEKMLNEFFNTSGYRIVMGGSSALAVSRFLKSELKVGLDFKDSEVPPLMEIEGVDLVSEGVVTFFAVCKKIEKFCLSGERDWIEKEDAASLICHCIMDLSNCVNLFVGEAKNKAHTGSDFPDELKDKRELAQKMQKILQSEKSEKVKIKYY